MKTRSSMDKPSGGEDEDGVLVRGSGMYKESSTCLRLSHDENGGKVEVVTFKRNDDADIDVAAAGVLGIKGERVLCFSLPGALDKKMGMALHMYIGVDAIEHKLPHNTNASQLWLCAHLPLEPPEVTPASIHGPVLITADDVKTEEFVDLTLEHWQQLMKISKADCENALFMC